MGAASTMRSEGRGRLRQRCDCRTGPWVRL